MIEGRARLATPLSSRASDGAPVTLFWATKAVHALFDVLEGICRENTPEARQLAQLVRSGLAGQSYTLALRVARALSPTGFDSPAPIEEENAIRAMAVLDTGDGIPGKALAKSEYPISMAGS
jgi:hypothetical protein